MDANVLTSVCPSHKQVNPLNGWGRREPVEDKPHHDKPILYFSNCPLTKNHCPLTKPIDFPKARLPVAVRERSPRSSPEVLLGEGRRPDSLRACERETASLFTRLQIALLFVARARDSEGTLIAPPPPP